MAAPGQTSPEPFDVVVVGARCAGSATAIHFANAGRSVLVLDRSRFPSDTLSSHTIFGAGVSELDALGVLPAMRRIEAAEIRGVRVGWNTTDGQHCPYLEDFPEDLRMARPLSAPRWLLDEVLVERTRECGVEVREGSTVTDVLWKAGRPCDVAYVDGAGIRRTVAAKLVVGADGVTSTIAQLVGSYVPYRWSLSERAAVYRYVDEPAAGPEALRAFHYRDGDSMVLAFPTAPPGRTIVMFVSDEREVGRARSDPEGYWEAKLDDHPQARERFGGARNPSALRIVEELPSYFRAASGPGWALAGDAGHFKDPIIGQGIRDAMWSGRELVEHTATVLDDPIELDRGLRRWERARERECMFTYFVGVHESLLVPQEPALARLATAIEDSRLPVGLALSLRDGSIWRVLSATAVAGTLRRALASAPSKRRDSVGLARDAGLLGRAGLHARRGAFRSPKTFSELEITGAGW